MNLVQLLSALGQSIGDDALDRLVVRAIEVKHGRAPKNPLALAYRCYYEWNNRWLANPRRLDYFRVGTVFRRMRLSLDDMIPSRVEPWDMLTSAATIVIMVGQRSIANPHGDEPDGLRHFALGVRDAAAIAYLFDFFQRDLGCDCQIELSLMPAHLEEAERKVEEVLARSEVAGIVSIGSDLVNLATLVLARRILDGRRPPARLVWNKATYAMAPHLQHSVLSEPSDRQVGIRRQDGVFHERIPDKEVVARLKRAKRRPGTFADCGLVILDGRHDRPSPTWPLRGGKPLLIGLCVGHGGNSTLAASMALTGTQFTRLFADSQQNPAVANCPSPFIEPRVVFNIVTVQRKKPSSHPASAAIAFVDDLVFDDEFQEGWDLVF